MPRLGRSPQKKGQQQSPSISDIDSPTVSQGQASPVSVPQRGRKTRAQKVDEQQPLSVKDELKTMFEDWKSTENTILQKLVKEVSEIKQQNREIQSSSAEIEKSISFMNTLYEDLKKKVEILEKESKQDKLQIAALEERLEDIQRNSKGACIEIRNVPLPEQVETKSALCKIVQNVGKAIDVNVETNTIKDVYRLNGKTTKGTVIAEFTTVLIKSEIIKATKTYNKKNPEQMLNSANLGFKDPVVPIFVSDPLTAKGRKLHYLARVFAKKHQYKFCWTSNGRVFLRKTADAPHIEVKSESQLLSLEASM